MPNPLPQPPADWFAGMIRCLVSAVGTKSMWGKLARPLGMLIIHRLIAINQGFRRLADRIAAGTYRPRRPFTRRPSENPKPRGKNKLPTSPAWLIKLVQETAGSASSLRMLFDDPAMAALMAAAPGPVGRTLRPLCRMLGVAPPAILAAPPRPRRVREKPPPPPRKPEPKWPHDPRPRNRLGFYKGPPPFLPLRPATAPEPSPLPRACGPPRRKPA